MSAAARTVEGGGVRPLWGVVPAVLVVSAVLAAPAARAEEGTRTVCATQVEASGNRAEGQEPQVDERLAKMKKKLPGRFASYHFLGEQCWDLAVDEGRPVSLPSPYRMEVLRLSNGDQGARVRWILFKADEKMNESVVEFRNHGFLWVGGPRTSEGMVFVLLHVHWKDASK